MEGPIGPCWGSTCVPGAAATTVVGAPYGVGTEGVTVVAAAAPMPTPAAAAAAWARASGRWPSRKRPRSMRRSSADA